MRLSLVKGETYLVVKADRKTFVGKYFGPGGRDMDLFVLPDGTNTPANPNTSLYSIYRERAPRLHRTQFAKAHWSLLYYIEGRVVQNGGLLDNKHLRINPSTHSKQSVKEGRAWDARSGTAIKGLPGYLRGYDDLDCIEDLITAGLVSRTAGTNEPTKYDLSPTGWTICSRLRKHIAYTGGSYYGFVF